MTAPRWGHYSFHRPVEKPDGMGGVKPGFLDGINRKNGLAGEGTWTHQYGDVGNTACSGDERVGLASGRDLSVSEGDTNVGESGYVGYEMWIRDLETSLYGIVGARHAHIDGFNYSPAMRAMAEKPWTYEELNAWIHSPRAYAPGNRMSYGGLANTQQRADLIAYLRSVSPSAPAP